MSLNRQRASIRGNELVTDTRSGSCTLTLAPTSTALTSEGACILVGSGAAGGIAITAMLDTFTSAFGSSTGGNATTTANFTLP